LEKSKWPDVTDRHRLCVRDRREKGIIYPRFPDHLVYHVLEISDDPVSCISGLSLRHLWTIVPTTGAEILQDQNIIRLIPDCLEFIDSAIAAGGTVLAHCNGMFHSTLFTADASMRSVADEMYRGYSALARDRGCVFDGQI
jgi:hypothetical protein